MTAPELPFSTIAITGVTSFIGVHLLQGFAKAASPATRLIGLHGRPLPGQTSPEEASSPADDNAMPWLPALRRLQQQDNIELIPLDLTNSALTESFIDARKPDLWIHHAGYARGHNSPDYDLARGHDVNIAPLGSLYAALSRNNCRAVISTGTEAEYGYPEHGRCQEDQPLWPESPYGLSKLGQTVRLRQLARQYNLPTRIARVFLPFGPMDKPEKLLPAVLNALLTEQPVRLSPCLQARDFLFIDDLVSGYLSLARDLVARPDQSIGLYNICSGTPVVLKDVLLSIVRLLDADPALLQFGATSMRPGEPMVLYGDNTGAKTLGWAPRPLDDGLSRWIAAARPVREGHQHV